MKYTRKAILLYHGEEKKILFYSTYTILFFTEYFQVLSAFLILPSSKSFLSFQKAIRWRVNRVVKMRRARGAQRHILDVNDPKKTDARPKRLSYDVVTIVRALHKYCSCNIGS